jgi:hypothetical protein
VRTQAPPFLTHIDPVGRKVVETVVAPELPSGGHVLVADSVVWASAYDDGTVVQLRP